MAQLYVIKIVDDKTYVQVEEQQPRREELVFPETSKRKKLKTLTEKKKTRPSKAYCTLGIGGSSAGDVGQESTNEEEFGLEMVLDQDCSSNLDI